MRDVQWGEASGVVYRPGGAFHGSGPPPPSYAHHRREMSHNNYYYHHHRRERAPEYELLYPHEISARIHGAGEGGASVALAGADAATAEAAGARPRWLEELEMENQKSIAFMAQLISGRPSPSGGEAAPSRHRRQRSMRVVPPRY